MYAAHNEGNYLNFPNIQLILKEFFQSPPPTSSFHGKKNPAPVVAITCREFFLTKHFSHHKSINLDERKN